MNFDRILAWAGDDDPARRFSKIQAFQLILILHHAASIWNDAIRARGQWDAEMILQLIAVNAACLAGVRLEWRRGAMIALAVLAFAQVISTFPLSSNHLMLEFLFPALAALFDFRRDEEQEFFLRSARWLFVIVFFYTGLQKLLQGYYFRAEFFSYLLSTSDRFRAVFQWTVPPDELARLMALDLSPESGPYRTSAPLLLAVSNATYLFEMLFAVLLFVPTMRVVAIAGTALLLVFIEAGAREIFFGALFLNVLLLFPRGDINRKAVPAFALVYLYVILARLGILPEFVFN